MKKRVSKLDGEPMSVEDFLKSLDEAAERSEERKRKEELLTHPDRLDGEPYTKEEIERMFEVALKSEEDKKK